MADKERGSFEEKISQGIDVGKWGELCREKNGPNPRATYFTIDELVSLIIEPNGSICKKILNDYRHLFETASGSSHNHQTWRGGYIDHVAEVMNLAFVDYRNLNRLRPLLFSLSDALLILFLHDLEKPWRFHLDVNGELQEIQELKTKRAKAEFRLKKLFEYGIIFTAEQTNAFKYVEGELDEYTNKRRVMGPLAAFCHRQDVWSARGWWDYPMEKSDPWIDAGRHRKEKR